MTCAGASIAGCADGGDGGGGGRRDASSGQTDGGTRDSGSTGECTRDDECEDDGIFCNGTVICRESRCIASGIPTCDDAVACTVDSCDPTADACQNVPDDSACPDELTCFLRVGCSDAPACEFDSDCADDGVFCNGVETCVEMEGRRQCRSSGTRDCADANSCSADECNDALAACVNTVYPDVLTNPAHCGTGSDDCVVCPAPATGAMHVVTACTEGGCGFLCEEGWFDTDSNLANGCECGSDPGSVDDPDDSFTDTNCDGIDGDAAHAIFVAPSGRDTQPGTRTQPKRTLAAAITAATAMGFDVYVGVGDYTITSTLQLANGVSIYGGYDAAASWARSDSTIAHISGPATAVRAQGISTPTVVDRIDVTAASNVAPGGASIAVHAIDAPGLIWRVGVVEAGQGGAGTGGTGGTRGDPGGDGNPSVGGVEYGGGCLGIGCSTNTRPGQQPGGTSSCGRTGGNGGTGGGANGGGSNGTTGAGGTMAGPGAGSAEQNGGSGANGTGGGAGTEGGAGSAAGSIVGDGWQPGNGGNGGTGTHGNGGGGGGGGGGDTPGACECNSSGDTGAGGGAGGCGGTGGNGGGGGGASFGFLIVRSDLTLELLEIRTSVGGDGGTGGTGGNGGDGGDGGLGSAEAGWTGSRDDDSQGRGGGGGDGGNGGRGGHGGGGGGGPTAGIARDAGSSISVSLISYTRGSSGIGGDSAGNRGQRGASMDELVL
ncbi:hypothetical protein [Sandaracinus amylolyticus]|uniref:hypothetical protein n=1 Tax=Sandaracinus amylolyticus TaxID=927083 RepID=UPI0022A7E8A9|nr:hypothetical protein [Sandaracinus amylolyticus]